MRSRRLPLGSPSRKERSGENAEEDNSTGVALSAASATASSSRAKLKQTPPSSSANSVKPEGKTKPRRPLTTSRGLPTLSSRPISLNMSTSPTPPESPSVSQAAPHTKQKEAPHEGADEETTVVEAQVASPHRPNVTLVEATVVQEGDDNAPLSKKNKVTTTSTPAAAAASLFVPGLGDNEMAASVSTTSASSSVRRLASAASKKNLKDAPAASDTASPTPKKRSAAAPPPSNANNNSAFLNPNLDALRPDSGKLVSLRLLVNHMRFTSAHAEQVSSGISSPRLSPTTTREVSTARSPSKASRVTKRSGASSPKESRSKASPATPPPPLMLGQDGNQYNCQVCGEFGNVLCCDGCPKVYHPDCIPLTHPTPAPNDNDKPWFCPSCVANDNNSASGNAAAASSATTTKSGRRTTKRVANPGGSSTDSPYVDSSTLEWLEDDEVMGETPKDLSDTKQRRRNDESAANAAGDFDHPAILSSKRERKRKAYDYHDENDLDRRKSEDRDEAAMASERGASNAHRNTNPKSNASNSLLTPVSSAKKKKKKKRARKESNLDLLVGAASGASSAAGGDHHHPLSSPSADAPHSPSPLGGGGGGVLDPLSALAIPQGGGAGGVVRATPAFIFFMVENRVKIERDLSRKLTNKQWNRLNRSGEKNAMVAKEAASVWAKLPVNEQRRFMETSMRDFEQKIIRWKEDKSIREMNEAAAAAGLCIEHGSNGGVGGDAAGGGGIRESAEDDQRLTWQRHERLYLGTSVGSKPFKIEPDQAYNRVLQDLLHDMRFHPTPMLSAERAWPSDPHSATTPTNTNPSNCGNIRRSSIGSHGTTQSMNHNNNKETSVASASNGGGVPTTDSANDHSQQVLIPYFDVHGPVSTSVGDACLGCLRSWNHFCPVLQRRVPAVEHRARLQPPVSSLLASRVGLGFRPYLTQQLALSTTKSNVPDEESELCEWRQSKQQQDIKNLKVVESCTLDRVNERMDDVVEFVEESMAMKVPEPPRPKNPSEQNNKAPSASTSQLRSLPIAAPRQLSEELSSSDTFRKCGRCRAIIEGDTGCVQCRRAQLVINMAKRQKQEGKQQLLKVHTSMLGRYNVKDLSDSQSAADEDVAAAMLRERWTPCTILPPEARYAPSPHNNNKNRRRFVHGDESAGSDEAAGSSADDAQDDNNYCRSAGEEEDAGPTKSGSGSSNDGGETDSKVDPESKEKPARSSRPSRLVGAPQDNVFEPHERQEVMERNRKAVTVFQKRMVNIACSGMLLALARRDPLKLFDQPVTDEAYYDVIKHPMFFCTMRDKIINNQYPTLGGFSHDVKQLCENALEYNMPTSIYAKGALELQEAYALMHKRASQWVGALKDAYANYLSHTDPSLQRLYPEGSSNDDDIDEAFADLAQEWPEAVRLLKCAEWLKSHAAADFVRTEENEIAYFGSLAVSRVAAAAEAALAPYTDSSGSFGPVVKRNDREDKELRDRVDNAASGLIGPVNLSSPSSWREESVHRLLRKVQSRRLDRFTASEQGCARCDGLIVDQDVKLNMKADAAVGKIRKNEDFDLPRVDGSRIDLTTGRASANVRAAIKERRKQTPEEQFDSVKDSCVSVRGSRIHGLGLFADQEFEAGDAVAEYVGEFISNEEFEARETIYRENRTQDYSFRINSDEVIDATCRGGPGRYANHDCDPNCASKIIPGPKATPHLKRVLIVALRNIKISEEITYDYQFPLEQDLNARIPCNCRSDECRGFMNWDLPEKGSNNKAVLVIKRGANMRDRIRRLNRPLKRDEL